MKRIRNIFLLVVVAGLLGGWFFGRKYYTFIYKSNVSLSENSRHFFIYSDWEYAEVLNSLKEQGILIDIDAFEWVANRKQYTNKVKAGRYLLEDGMNNNQLVNLLRSGEQEEVTLTMSNLRLTSDLCGLAGRKLELDSALLLSMLSDNNYLQKYGFDNYRVKTMFIPNTYRFYWNTNEEAFLDRMAKEYKAFWNDERKHKATQLGLMQSEVTTLASIVEKEALKAEEKPRIAGLYLNRIRRKMKLQADPTVVYALGDFDVNRVLKEHLKVDSPYNTYKYSGLPPGPICIPEISSIDAVLNSESHTYLYMCAKEDFSGYHNFASTLKEHNRNAREYQKALNKRRIFK